MLARLYDWHDYDEILAENERLLADDSQALFWAFLGGGAAGVAHASIRTEYVEGRTDDLPMGYLEAVFVSPERRRKGVGRRLVEACEGWAASKGCRDFASDCKLDNTESLRFHLGAGFREAQRNIHFVKGIGKTSA